MIACNQDVGEAFVVTQQHVVAWAQTLDQVCFQQQRFGFRARRHEFHLRGFPHHLEQTVGMQATLRIVRNALLQAAALPT